jgi:hypothetical protein
MGIQEIAVFVMILAAGAYFAKGLFVRAKSFSPSSGCKTDCGCSPSAEKKNIAA